MRVNPSDIASVVTSLEMRTRPRPAPMAMSPLRLVRWPQPDPDRYRALFRRVGTRWLWYSRLAMDDARLAELIRQPTRAIYAVTDPRGIEVGLLELDNQQPADCVIQYLALVPELVGQGHGRWLIGNALALAWRPGVERVMLNTCSLDHPHALSVYLAAGFVAVTRTIETFPDPRLIGLLPMEAAPQIPILGPERGAVTSR